jgi:hypothetical protein
LGTTTEMPPEGVQRVPDVYEGNSIPAAGEKPDTTQPVQSDDSAEVTRGPEHVTTPYAHGVGPSADPAAPGEGEGSGIGSSGDSGGTPD